jgi:hypothetical protein
VSVLVLPLNVATILLNSLQLASWSGLAAPCIDVDSAVAAVVQVVSSLDRVSSRVLCLSVLVFECVAVSVEIDAAAISPVLGYDRIAWIQAALTKNCSSNIVAEFFGVAAAEIETSLVIWRVVATPLCERCCTDAGDDSEDFDE